MLPTKIRDRGSIRREGAHEDSRSTSAEAYSKPFGADLVREVAQVSVAAFPTEYHADAALLLVEGQPVFGIILNQPNLRRHV